MSQSHVDIPLSTIHIDDNNSYNSVTESSVLTRNTLSVKKPKPSLSYIDKNAKTKKKKNIQKKKEFPKHKKESNNQKKGKERNQTKKEKEQKKGTKVVKQSPEQVALSSITSKSKLKLVPKALEKQFNKTSGMPWKKIKLPKDPTLLLTEEKLSHAKHDNEIPISEKGTLHMPKGLNRSKQAQIDALVNAITTMCALVKEDDK